MKDGKITNAKITGVSISMADHGVLTFDVWLESNEWSCGLGGYIIGNGYLGASSFKGSGKGLEAMMRIMDTVGVEKWEDLKGKYVRCIDSVGVTIDEIGNIIEDKWFNIREFFEKE